MTRKNNRYYVVLDLGRDENGRRRRKWHSGYSTRKEAERALAELVSSVHQGTYVNPDRRPLRDYLRAEWLPSVRSTVKASTWDSYRRNIELHIVPVLGNVPLQALTAAQVNGLYGVLLQTGRSDGKGLSPKSVRYVHTILHKAMKDAASWNLVPRNVVALARAPRTPPPGSSMRTWSADEVRSFLNIVKTDRLLAAWVLAATTGMRRGEVLGVRWDDLDLDAARLSVRQTLVSVAYEIQYSTPKSSRGRRSLALDRNTVQVLRHHRAAQGRERLAFGAGYEDNGLVFTREDGAPIHPDRFTQMFDRLVSNSPLPRIRLHDLRHTYASLALRSGMHAKVVSERLGHATVAFTLDVYAHTVPAMEEAAAQMVADLILGEG